MSRDRTYRCGALLLLVALALVACGDDDTTVAGDDATTTSTSTATTSAPAEDDVDGGGGEADSSSPDDAVAFFVDSEQACVDHADVSGNPPPEPERFDGATAAATEVAGVYLLTDGLGDRLLVDLNDSVLYSEDGPDGVLIRAYSFGCPETLYLGTLDH